jgi:hypothetical protein
LAIGSRIVAWPKVLRNDKPLDEIPYYTFDRLVELGVDDF